MFPAFAADDDFSGKTMCVFGDSYVANHLRPYTEAWHSKVAERMGMKYINFGRNGSSIAFDRSKEGFGRGDDRALQGIARQHRHTACDCRT